MVRLPPPGLMGLVFAALIAAAASLPRFRPREANSMVTRDASFATPTSFDAAAIGVVAVPVALCATWW